MKAFVNQRFSLATAFIRQHETLTMNEITARYKFEMATRIFPDKKNVMDDAATGLKHSEMERLQFEKVIEDVTGLNIDELRFALAKLETVLNRQIEVENELLKGELLSPVLAEVLKVAADTDESQQAKAELEKRIAENPVFTKHYEELTKLAEQLAEEIQFRDISQIQVARPQLLVPVR